MGTGKNCLYNQFRKGEFSFAIFAVMILITVLSVIIAIVMLVSGEHHPYEADVAFALITMPAMVTLGVFYKGVMPHFILRFVMEESTKVFLNGGYVLQYFTTRLFPRLSRYVGYELSHEAAALMMLALKSCKRSKLNIGLVEKQDNDYQLHAWIEMELLGTYWVIDPILEPGLITSWDMYYSKNHPRVERRITHATFWGYPMVQDFYRLISNPETSFVFNKLRMFTNMGAPNYRLRFEETGHDSLNDEGKFLDLIWLTAFGADKPVDALLVARMIEHELSVGPKRRHYRKLMRLTKTRQAAVDAALEYEKKTGVTPTVCFESLTEFSLMANGVVVS